MADPNQIKSVKELGRRDILLCVAREKESSRLWVGSSDSKVYVVDPLAEKPDVAEMTGHEGYVMGVALAGEVAVSGAYDGRLIWWDIKTHSQVRTVEAHQRNIRKVLATPDAKQIVSIADDMVCRVWDAASGSLVHELRGHQEKTPQHFISMLYACAM